MRVNLGEKYGRWLTLSHNHARGRKKTECICDCGATRLVTERYLLSGTSRSCGCLNSEETSQRMLIHGKAATNDYRAWQGMLNRCRNKNHPSFKHYGGRGIKVAPQWVLSYDTFLSDMGDRPKGMTIDRINVDGDYEPSNCRWASRSTQSRNQRNRDGVNGVNERWGKWHATLAAAPKRHLGVFEDWFEAVCSRKSAELKYWVEEKAEIASELSRSEGHE